MPATASAGISRGCGTRTSGGVYVECGLSDAGIDISHFMADPVTPFEVDMLRGQEVRERNGTYHLFDHVGEKHYPTAADIFEEVRRHGASRRASINQQFERLGPDSRLVLVHPRAFPEPTTALMAIEEELGLLKMPSYRHHCMLYRKTKGRNSTHLEQPPNDAVPCTRFWWLDAGWERPVNRSAPGNDEEAKAEVERSKVGGLSFPYPAAKEKDGYVRQGTRHVGDTEYRTHGGPLAGGASKETGPVDAKFTSGIVFSLPITAISVIESEDETCENRLDDLKSRSTVPVVKQPN